MLMAGNPMLDAGCMFGLDRLELILCGSQLLLEPGVIALQRSAPGGAIFGLSVSLPRHSPDGQWKGDTLIRPILSVLPRHGGTGAQMKMAGLPSSMVRLSVAPDSLPCTER